MRDEGLERKKEDLTRGIFIGCVKLDESGVRIFDFYVVMLVLGCGLWDKMGGCGDVGLRMM